MTTSLQVMFFPIDKTQEHFLGPFRYVSLVGDNLYALNNKEPIPNEEIIAFRGQHGRGGVRGGVRRISGIHWYVTTHPDTPCEIEISAVEENTE